MESYNEIWQAVLEYFKPPKITETAYNLWIKNIEFAGFDGSAITLKFERKINHDIFNSQYKEAFRNAFSEVLGFNVDIVCQCNEPVVEEAKSLKDYQFNSPLQEKHLEDYKNEQFTFDNFIVGSSNRFAYAAARAVASDPAGQKKDGSAFSNYNPLFIYGNSGLGKTHILNAICNEVKEKFPEMNILYVRAEEFTNEFMQALQYKTTDEFHAKYRQDVDLFLVDDIQFIAGKDSTEQEFFHTFDAFVYAGKQVVLTSDRPPKDIQSITDRLRSRFEDGLIADVQEPEFETRCEIIKRKAMLLKFEIPDDVVEFIAENIKTNIRQLEGVTKKLYALCDINNHKPTIPLARSVIKIVIDDTQPLPITIQKIVDEVSRTTGITSEDIYSKKQKANIAHARQITFYVIRNVTNMSLEDIGEEFGKHHTTVMYNINQIESEMETNSKLDRQIKDIINNVKSDQ